MFSVNTNLGAMAALQTLRSTNASLLETQNEVSTGKKVSSAADNPAVYAIAQNMNANIAGLAAVQDGLSFGAQVVGVALSSAGSINSTLATLKQNITQGQQQGLSATQINQGITASLAQIDTFANSATFNGVNLLAGATGNGVTSTKISMLTDTNGGSFAVGGSGTQALNATSSGLGLSGLDVSQTGLQVSLGANASLTLNVGTSGSGATTITFHTANAAGSSGLPQTAQNPAETWTFVLNDGQAGNGAKNVAAAFNNLTDAGGASAVGTSSTADFTASTTNGTLVLNPNINTNGYASITSLGGKDAMYSVATAVDANGNATAVTHVVSVDVSNLTASAGALNSSGNASAISAIVQAMNAVGFNASTDANNNIDVTGNNVDSSVLASGAATSASTSNATNSAAPVVVGQLSGPQAAINTVQAAINKLANITSVLGAASGQISGMQTFTSSLSDALTAGVGALTDADLAAESAKLQSLQTKQQLAMQSLSIANQAPQSLLSLFR